MKTPLRLLCFFTLCALLGALATTALCGPSPTKPSQPPPSAQTTETNSVALELERLRSSSSTTLGQRLKSVLGLGLLLGLCWLLSDNRWRVDWRLVAWGLGLQFAFGVLVLKTGPGLWFFSRLNDGTMALLGFTKEGSDFLFRSFSTGAVDRSLVNFTFHVLPTIIFFSSLMTVGYHLGLMQKIVHLFAAAMHKTMRCSGAETLSTAANIFVGQTEAPLVVKPFINEMTRSELLAVMVGGFANTAGGVLAAYVSILHPYFPDIAGHLIAQSVMSAPAALACAKIAMPETDSPKTSGQVRIPEARPDANLIDAASRGATEGLQLAFNVAAMLLAFIALIAMANALLGWSLAQLGMPGVTLERVLGLACWPLAWAMGVPVQDCAAVGQLLGVKTVVNEFVAYLQMADMLKAGRLSYRSVVIASYALSGFANFSSIAIQIGGISAIAPARRQDLARLGLKAMIVGAIATFMTAAIAGILVG